MSGSEVIFLEYDESNLLLCSFPSVFSGAKNIFCRLCTRTQHVTQQLLLVSEGAEHGIGQHIAEVSQSEPRHRTKIHPST